MMPTAYHGTPMNPDAALRDVMPGRAGCVSFYRPEDLAPILETCPQVMLDNGAFSEWQAAMRRGEEWFIRDDWTPYYDWLEPILFHPGRWAVIPDAPGAPSQLNDTLIPQWPFGQKGAPLWHMDGPIDRLLRLCDKFDRVCLGWVGEFDPELGKIRPDQKAVDCAAFHARMEEVDLALGNRWPVLHMMRGLAVLFDYPFASADSTSLAQNGHRYASPLFQCSKWAGRHAYANRLERPDWSRSRVFGNARRLGWATPWPHMADHGLVERFARRSDGAENAEQLSLQL